MISLKIANVQRFLHDLRTLDERTGNFSIWFSLNDLSVYFQISMKYCCLPVMKYGSFENGESGTSYGLNLNLNCLLGTRLLDNLSPGA